MAHQSTDDALSSTVSARVTRLYLDTFGKGPMHAETFIHGDVITTLLRGVFTDAEKLMVDGGKVASVHATRMDWQAVTDPRFRAEVERTVGRTVLAAVSGFDALNDMATEVFVLERA